MISRSILFVVVLLGLVAPMSRAAGFDCAKASTRSEKLICSDMKLLDLDEKLATAYRKAYHMAADKQGLKAAQVAWLKERDGCETKGCMSEKYQSRIAVLETVKPDFSWLKAYSGKSTNAVVWDKRFIAFTKTISPRTSHDFGLDEDNLAGVLRDALGGPPDNVKISDSRYLTLSGCMFRFCKEKGFIWVDLQETTAAAAVVHFDVRKPLSEPVLLVFSTDFNASTLPQRFRGDLNKWAVQSGTKSDITKVFIDATGKSSNF